MSLWYKQIDQISFGDIEAFCAQRQREGLRLDYKGDIPRDLHTLVAAFANTLGGLTILGVGANTTTNEPIWPPQGMPGAPGIEERIIAICRDNIYLPVRPQISPIVSNPHAAGTVLVVVRIDESLEAPHAVNQGRRVYERTGNQNKPYDFASIERIQHLLTRRQNLETMRKNFVEQDIGRSTRKLAESRLNLGELVGLSRLAVQEPGPRGLPLRWASVTPVYPWQDLCEPRRCYEHLKWWGDARYVQRVPGGAFIEQRGVEEKMPVVTGCASLNAKGHFFAIEPTLELVSHAQLQREMRQTGPQEHFVGYEATLTFAGRVFDFAAQFYKQPDVVLPGFLHVAIGLVDVLDLRVALANSAGRPLVDDTLGEDMTISIDQFLSGPTQAATPLFEKFAFGCDLPLKKRTL